MRKHYFKKGMADLLAVTLAFSSVSASMFPVLAEEMAGYTVAAETVEDETDQVEKGTATFYVRADNAENQQSVDFEYGKDFTISFECEGGLSNISSMEISLPNQALGDKTEFTVKAEIDGEEHDYGTVTSSYFVPDALSEVDLEDFEGAKKIQFTLNVSHIRYMETFTEGDFTYQYKQINGKKEATIYKCNNFDKEKIVIPEQINGVRITEIGSLAFTNAAYISNTTVTEIEVPENITSIGYAAFSGCSNLSSVKLPSGLKEISSRLFSGCSSLKQVEIPERVEYLGESAFEGCIAMEKVVLPERLVSIEAGAFEGCIAMEKVVLPERLVSIGSKAFYECMELASVEIPDSVTAIEEGAFERCISLEEIVLPEGLVSIGDAAFRDCISLTSVKLPGSLAKIGNGAFLRCGKLKNLELSGENPNFSIQDNVLYNKDKTVLIAAFANVGGRLEIPDTVSRISDSAFESNLSVTGVIIPDSVEEIETSAFSDCKNLTDITLPAGLTEIGEYVFSGCESLTEITFPAGLTEIDGSAFSGCENLKSVEIPDGVTHIGYSAFQGCKGLTEITFPAGLTEIDGCAFSGCENLKSVEIPDGVTRIGYSAFQDCEGLTEITFPAGLTEIDEYAFSGCENLKSVEIPDRVTRIGYSAFQNCKGLTEIAFPAGLTEINGYAFFGCGNLKSVEIPDGVTRIGYSAFQNCKGLTEITLSAGLTEIDGSAFSGCENLTSIEIPAGVINLASDAFAGCTGLESIMVAPENTSYTAIDGALYDKAAETLIYYPGNRSDVRVADTVTAIKSDAFSDAQKVESFSLPESPDWIVLKSTGKVDVPAVEDTEDDQQLQVFVQVPYAGAYEISAGEDSRIVYMRPNCIYNCRFYRDAETVSVELKDVNAGKCGENTDYFIEDGVLTISGSGEAYADEWEAFFSEIKDGIEEIVIEDGITSIPDDGFKGMASLKKVTLADSVTVLGESAFSSDFKMDELVGGTGIVKIGKNALSDTLWRINAEKEKIDGCWMTRIGKCFIREHFSTIYFYRRETSISPIRSEHTADGKHYSYLPDGTIVLCGGSEDLSSPVDTAPVTMIADNAFVVFDGSGDGGINEYVIFRGKLELPEGLEVIGDNSFGSQQFIEEVVFPDSMVGIGANAFYQQATGTSAFPRASRSFLSKVTLNNGLKWIGEEAFINCSFKEITIPSSVTEIGERAFGYLRDKTYYEKINDFVIKGKKGSAAETYAIENGFAFEEVEDVVVYGDTDGDGVIGPKDAALLRRAVAGWDVTINMAAADVDGDGIVGPKDAALLRRAVAGWDVQLG